MANQTTPADQQFILNGGQMRHLITIPDEGLLVRLRVNGSRLAATFENGTYGTSLQMITWALERLEVEPILDPQNPFEVYRPGPPR